ncbi:MAG: hypothetical protein QOF68_867, partial [Gaiellales bacterium]|nr:hypothetical protein [Gaiellales bacterium]
GYAEPHALDASDLERALVVLSDWCAAPEWAVAR